jgi:predicted RNA-binding Zn ribbon-like protein
VIVRILGEGQYVVPDSDQATLETLDRALVAAVDTHDEDAFTTALAALTAGVRKAGQAVPDDDFAPSDLVVPFTDATLAETEKLLADAKEADADEP